MGVTGLLPFLKNSTDQINLSQFAGMTAAVDAYVWLHRGAFCCGDKLAKGEKTTAYIGYGIKMLHLLLSYNIKPILVFDGRRLHAKKETEAKRSELRKQNRMKADELVKAGRENEARDLFRRCVDINHEMALEFIKAARKMQVDCIVAPHEADAQMAYLNRIGLAQFIITEDSDLILFGCSQILYKLDVTGNGFLLRLDRLNLSMGRPHDPPHILLTKLRHICILSGCDYVNSLPGVGLVKAKKFVMASSDPDICNAVKRLPFYLNLRVKIDDEYIEKVRHAELTFCRQLVFDPRTRKQLTLDGQEVTNDEPYSGEFLDPNVALDLAVGNIDPFSMKRLGYFDPNTLPVTSIWHTDYKSQKSKEELKTNAFVTTKGKEVVVETKGIKFTKPRIVDLSDEEVASMYTVRMTECIVSKSEIKCSIFDGTCSKEVICSSYFAQENMGKNEFLSPVNSSPGVKIEELEEEKTSNKTPRKLSRKELFIAVGEPVDDMEDKSPKKLSSTEIMSIIDSSPSKLERDMRSIVKNPFSKKLCASPKKEKQNLPLKVCNNENQNEPSDLKISADESPLNTNECADQSVYADALSESDLNNTQSTCYETASDMSQDFRNSQSSTPVNLLDRFRNRKPLFKRSVQTEQVESCEVKICPKSPVLGKRKRPENTSPGGQKITSSYFNRFEKGLFSTSVSVNTATSASSRSITNSSRNLASAFQWSQSEESTNAPPMQSSLAKKSMIPCAVRVRKGTKLTSGQSKLFNFGFKKK